MSTASTSWSATRKSAMARLGSTPWRTAHARRAGDTSAAQRVTPSSPSTRRCFSPQRPRPTSRMFTAGGSVAGDEVAAHVLDDLIPEEPGVHPADGQEVREGDGRAIQDTVLRPAEAPRPVAHRHLDHAVAPHLQERRDEAVKAAIEHEPPQAFPPEGAEGAPAVVDRFVGHPVAELIRDPRRDAPHEAVALRALDAPAGRRIPVVEVREQRGNVARVVLEV